MPRGASERVRRIRAELRHRLEHGFERPGDRFHSTRELAARYGVSFQTADRLLGELVEEGLLVRRPSSGTFLPGAVTPLRRVALVFDPRSRRRGSFGQRLERRLVAELEAQGIRWRRAEGLPAEDEFPVLWESAATVEALRARRRYALLMHQRPPAGVAASFFDCGVCDDFSGGGAAGELLASALGEGARVAAFGGPEGDARSRERIRGVREKFPQLELWSAGTWFGERARAGGLVELAPDGIFAANDGLAVAVQRAFREAGRGCPPLVGFDDAPLAQSAGLSTIRVPMGRLVEVALGVIRERLGGEGGAAFARVLSLRPIVRDSCVPLAWKRRAAR